MRVSLQELAEATTCRNLIREFLKRGRVHLRYGRFHLLGAEYLEEAPAREVSRRLRSCCGSSHVVMVHVIYCGIEQGR
jgi:hypothetical protein